MMQCVFAGCHRIGVTNHHVYKGHGNRVPCVFAESRKTRPARLFHLDGCTCNEMPLCQYHHRLAHHLGDEWLYEHTQDVIVGIKIKEVNNEVFADNVVYDVADDS